MQIGIVVLVAALMSGAIVSVLTRVAGQQSGERVLGIAQTVALIPAVRAAFNSPDPPAIIQPLAESVRRAADLSFVVVANRDLIRYSHPNPDLVGRPLQDPPLPEGAIPEDDSRALRGESFFVEEDGSLGRSIRAKVPLYADGSGS